MTSSEDSHDTVEAKEITQKSQVPPESEATPGKKRPMTESQKANLMKAREARSALLKDPKRYPHGKKREMAEERLNEEIRKKAEVLAETKALEILEKRKQEKELKELAEWKKTMALIEKSKAKEGSKEAKPSKKAPKSAPKSAPKKKKKVETDTEDESADEYIETPTYQQYRQYSQSFIDHFLD
ncbi:MAG: hypothetical protein JWO77_3903 [Ilumatobacteraceae bacterium]|nr:hypothetical protein [Ilumatobacteraceae bacterium]MDB5177435.1 hypothetical protein [Candidatus Saccharibacteria bacterium]